MNLPANPTGALSAAEGGILLAALLVLTAISWTALRLYERRAERREQQRGVAQP